MDGFAGTLKLTVIEAGDLRPTDFATRHQGVLITKNCVDTYIVVDIDDVPIARTQTKPKTNKPIWNEDFVTEVQGTALGLTVFHDTAFPPDEFVANCSIMFEDILLKKPTDLWVN